MYQLKLYSVYRITRVRRPPKQASLA